MNFLQKLTCLYWDLVTKVGFFTDDQPNVLYIYDNKPLAPRGHVTNASFKQWVGMLLMPKINRAHKNYLTPEIWEEKHLRENVLWHLDFSTN